MRLIALFALFVPGIAWAGNSFTFTITQTSPISSSTAPDASGPMKESMETMKKAWKVHTATEAYELSAADAGADAHELETVKLSYDKIQIEAQIDYFDGKLLRADDLSSEQSYVLAEGDLVGAELALFRDGKLIGVYDNVEGVRIAGLMDRSGIEVRKGGYEGEILVTSWSLSASSAGEVAIFPDGTVISFTELEVTVPVDGLSIEEAESFGGFTYDGIGRLTQTTGG